MGQEPLWHICGAGLFLVLAVVHRRARSSGILLMTLWNLSGVILHELMHLLAGLLFRARPSTISLLPRRVGDGWRLGSVSFTGINPFNAVPVALAPLGLGAVAFLAADNWFLWWTPSLPSTMALYATLFLLLYNAVPSRQDLRVACNLKSLLLYGTIGIAGIWYCMDTIAAGALRMLQPFLR